MTDLDRARAIVAQLRGYQAALDAFSDSDRRRDPEAHQHARIMLSTHAVAALPVLLPVLEVAFAAERPGVGEGNPFDTPNLKSREHALHCFGCGGALGTVTCKCERWVLGREALTNALAWAWQDGRSLAPPASPSEGEGVPYSLVLKLVEAADAAAQWITDAKAGAAKQGAHEVLPGARIAWRKRGDKERSALRKAIRDIANHSASLSPTPVAGGGE
jgi:hypothetical protein